MKNAMKTAAALLLLLLLSSLAIAQDGTQEAAPAATVDAPVVINIAAPQTPVSTSADGSLWGYVIVIGGVIVAGFVSLSFILQGIGNRAQAAANNPLEIAVIEKAYDSIPSAVVTALIDPLKASLERSDEALRKALDFIQKATDKVPESEKPATQSSRTPLTIDSTGRVTSIGNSTISYTPSDPVEPPQAPT